MTDKSTIETELYALVGENFNAWKIGLTNDPMRLKKSMRDVHKQDVSRWQQWQAASLADARSIESTFIGYGTSSEQGHEHEVVSDDFPVYVFAF